MRTRSDKVRGRVTFVDFFFYLAEKILQTSTYITLIISFYQSFKVSIFVFVFGIKQQPENILTETKRKHHICDLIHAQKAP